MVGSCAYHKIVFLFNSFLKLHYLIFSQRLIAQIGVLGYSFLEGYFIGTICPFITNQTFPKIQRFVDFVLRLTEGELIEVISFTAKIKNVTI